MGILNQKPDNNDNQMMPDFQELERQQKQDIEQLRKDLRSKELDVRQLEDEVNQLTDELKIEREKAEKFAVLCIMALEYIINKGGQND